ncbi:cysteine rich repeat-containing protein [Bradyrhizobium sp. SRS-191]|uniref:cysteine rich repeat-containing protein n=1 Tax=Bradyrhizobium sp. SRS-191 TaxID=2962606 RepID=UPI00211F2F5E|nr:cysteine rich repeat-containing protein [Bradyrhizobium sp. SRS-191]
MKKLATAILFTLTVAVVPAAHAQRQPTDEERTACQADYDKFCLGLIPGGGRIIACLQRNYAQLADTCKKMLDAYKAEGKE